MFSPFSSSPQQQHQRQTHSQIAQSKEISHALSFDNSNFIFDIFTSATAIACAPNLKSSQEESFSPYSSCPSASLSGDSVEEPPPIEDDEISSNSSENQKTHFPHLQFPPFEDVDEQDEQFAGPNENQLTRPPPPPGLHERPKCIYVGNLDPRVTEFHLRQLFSDAGKVSQAKIIHDRNIYRGGFRYGFIEYASSDDAEVALMTMNARRIYGTEIRVNWAYTSNTNCLPLSNTLAQPLEQSSINCESSGDGSPSPIIHHSPSPSSVEVFHIFVGDLSQEVNDYVLANAFSGWSSFCEARIMWDFVTGRSRGFGFVAFKERRDADEAIEKMNGQVLGTRQIRCNWASYRNNTGFCLGKTVAGSTDPQAEYSYISAQTFPINSTIYLGNLPPSIREDSDVHKLLEEAFSCPGKRLEKEEEDDSKRQLVEAVSSVKLQPEKGFCFVKFHGHSQAVLAIMQLNGRHFDGRELKCFWGREREHVLKRRVFG